jgi:hypothetical protein
MILFRLLLLVLTGAFMLYFLVLVRRSAIKRLFVAAFFGTGAAFVLMPELANRIAWFFGIGRGADFVFYLSTVFLFFLVFNIYLKFTALEARQTQLVRELALRHPSQEPGAESVA